MSELERRSTCRGRGWLSRVCVIGLNDPRPRLDKKEESGRDRESESKIKKKKLNTQRFSATLKACKEGLPTHHLLFSQLYQIIRFNPVCFENCLSVGYENTIGV